jgi:hypothetical protein
MWGYDPGFMALMPAALTVAPEDIITGDVRAMRYSRTRSPKRNSAAPSRLTILADPNAAGFYERNGAVRIGEATLGRGARPSAAALELGLYPAG